MVISKEPKTKYLLSIDIMRAVAILLMIQVHFVENLSPREASSAGLYDLSKGLGTLSAPIFSFLVGLSLWLWLSNQIEAGRKEAEIARVVRRRGILLFVAGLIFAVVIWRPESIFIWDILTFLGTATLIVYLLRKWASWKLIGLIVLIFITSPFLRSVTDYASHWRGTEYLYDFTLQDVTLGFLLHGYFPILPWICFPLLGWMVGRTYFDLESKSQFNGRRSAVVGLCLALLAGLGNAMNGNASRLAEPYLNEITFYPASTTYVLGMMGILLLGFWILFTVYDERRIGMNDRVKKFFKRYSRFSLTTYIVHHAVHVWPLYILAAYEGRRDPWWYYADAVSTPVAFLLSLLFIVIFYGILIFWEKRRWYGFEGVLRRLSGA